MPAETPKNKKVLRYAKGTKDLYLYQKADTLYQLTYYFCERFLPAYGDRTVDQMVQAARSGKQNIVEGIEDGKTSAEMELKLLNVARASLQELREDFADYLNTRHLTLWTPDHPRYAPMLDFCRNNNCFDAYAPHLPKLSAEELCNMALSLCHFTDKMLNSYLQRLEKEFIEKGGIKERMHAARTGYRQAQDQELLRLRQENQSLRTELAALKAELAKLKGEA